MHGGGGARSTARSDAERRVQDALRAALPDEYRLYPNVRWIHKEHRDAPARDGETDLVIVHPQSGLLIVETKGGAIRRGALGRWWSGSNALKPGPFEQAETSKHALVRKLAELPDWPGARPRSEPGTRWPSRTSTSRRSPTPSVAWDPMRR